ncbi:MAG TPA: hypothetical protein VMD05_04805 [Candidatus Nanoarchaeia archaeon]|nr:hypothetical protein [Candidatus Nanoarchaeia archaeon]
MQKTKSKILTLVFLSAMMLAMIPLAAAVSPSNILINATTAPSVAGQQIASSGTLNLYFGNVTVLGAQFQLYVSTNGLANIGASDTAWGPLFLTGNLTQTSTSSYTGFKVGFNWVNGTLPALAGGNYYVKLYDGNPADTVVTDTYFTVIGGFTVKPTSGPAGASLVISGSGFLTNDYVNVTYADILAPHGTIANLTATDNMTGAFSITVPAPDTLTNLAPGLQVNSTSAQNIIFTVQQNKTGVLATTQTYTENARGILQVGAAVATTGNVYGNLTDLTGTVSVPVGQTLYVSGNSFYPGTVNIYFDNTSLLTTTTANATGFFNVSITIPITTVGTHTILAADTDANMIVFINVLPTLILTPKTGVVGTTVAVTGFGLPANSALYIYWHETSLGDGTWYWTNNATTGANGQFNVTLSFNVPHAYGGIHAVTAYTTYTGLTSATPTAVSASANFNVTPTLVLTPSGLNNTGALAWANATGLLPSTTYLPDLDNLQLGLAGIVEPYATGPASAANGDLAFAFVDAGLRPGMHVVSLAAEEAIMPAVYTTFNVGILNDPTATLVSGLNTTVTTAGNVTSLLPLLTSINSTVNANTATLITIQTATGTIQTTLAALNASIIAINGNVATLSTTLGTVNTNIQGVSTSVSGLSSSISGIQGSITSINNGIATVTTNVGSVKTELDTVNAVLAAVAGQNANITTSLGTVQTSLDSIGTTVTSIHGDTATIITDLGTLTGTVTGISGDTATIKTDLGTMQTSIGNLGTTTNAIQSTLGSVQSDVSSTKTTTAGLSPLIIVAIVLALIAAIAAIASIVLMRRKIAG